MTFDPRECPHCGSDAYLAKDYARLEKTLVHIRSDYEKQAAQFAVDRATWRLKEISREEGRKFLQQKTHKQRQVINRLEAKLRKLGTAPYGEDS